MYGLKSVRAWIEWQGHHSSRWAGMWSASDVEEPSSTNFIDLLCMLRTSRIMIAPIEKWERLRLPELVILFHGVQARPQGLVVADLDLQLARQLPNLACQGCARVCLKNYLCSFACLYACMWVPCATRSSSEARGRPSTQFLRPLPFPSLCFYPTVDMYGSPRRHTPPPGASSSSPYGALIEHCCAAALLRSKATQGTWHVPEGTFYHLALRDLKALLRENQLFLDGLTPDKTQVA